MKLNNNIIINSHVGKKAVVIGHGASADRYLQDNNFLKDKIIIGCNLWFRHYEIVPNFWVFANPDLNMKIMSNVINYYYKNTDNILVYCDTIDLTDKKLIEELYQNVKYLPYDHIHFNKQKCFKEPCCVHLDNERNTIQEELAKYTNVNYTYSTGNSVLLHAMAISILIGCSDIDVIGFDRNYRTGYCKDLQNYNKFDLDEYLFEVPHPCSFDGLTYNLNRDFNIIQQSAKNINVRIQII